MGLVMNSFNTNFDLNGSGGGMTRYMLDTALGMNHRGGVASSQLLVDETKPINECLYKAFGFTLEFGVFVSCVDTSKTAVKLAAGDKIHSINSKSMEEMSGLLDVDSFVKSQLTMSQPECHRLCLDVSRVMRTPAGSNLSTVKDNDTMVMRQAGGRNDLNKKNNKPADQTQKYLTITTAPSANKITKQVMNKERTTKKCESCRVRVQQKKISDGGTWPRVKAVQSQLTSSTHPLRLSTIPSILPQSNFDDQAKGDQRITPIETAKQQGSKIIDNKTDITNANCDEIDETLKATHSKAVKGDDSFKKVVNDLTPVGERNDRDAIVNDNLINHSSEKCDQSKKKMTRNTNQNVENDEKTLTLQISSVSTAIQQKSQSELYKDRKSKKFEKHLRGEAKILSDKEVCQPKQKSTSKDKRENVVVTSRNSLKDDRVIESSSHQSNPVRISSSLNQQQSTFRQTKFLRVRRSQPPATKRGESGIKSLDESNFLSSNIYSSSSDNSTTDDENGVSQRVTKSRDNVMSSGSRKKSKMPYSLPLSILQRTNILSDSSVSEDVIQHQNRQQLTKGGLKFVNSGQVERVSPSSHHHSFTTVKRQNVVPTNRVEDINKLSYTIRSKNTFTLPFNRKGVKNVKSMKNGSAHHCDDGSLDRLLTSKRSKENLTYSAKVYSNNNKVQFSARSIDMHLKTSKSKDNVLLPDFSNRRGGLDSSRNHIEALSGKNKTRSKIGSHNHNSVSHRVSNTQTSHKLKQAQQHKDEDGSNEHIMIKSFSASSNSSKSSTARSDIRNYQWNRWSRPSEVTTSVNSNNNVVSSNHELLNDMRYDTVNPVHHCAIPYVIYQNSNDYQFYKSTGNRNKKFHNHPLTTRMAMETSPSNAFIAYPNNKQNWYMDQQHERQPHPSTRQYKTVGERDNVNTVSKQNNGRRRNGTDFQSTATNISMNNGSVKKYEQIRQPMMVVSNSTSSGVNRHDFSCSPHNSSTSGGYHTSSHRHVGHGDLTLDTCYECESPTQLTVSSSLVSSDSFQNYSQNHDNSKKVVIPSPQQLKSAHTVNLNGENNHKKGSKDSNHTEKYPSRYHNKKYELGANQVADGMFLYPRDGTIAGKDVTNCGAANLTDEKKIISSATNIRRHRAASFSRFL